MANPQNLDELLKGIPAADSTDPLEGIPAASDVHPSVADESMLGKAWRIATTPLTNIGSQAAAALQEPYNPTPEQSAEVQGIPVVGGMLNTGMNAFNTTQKAMLGGAGHFVDEQSSPLNLALLASGLGETKMAGNLIGDTGRTAASYATRALSAPIAAHGASEVYNEPTIGGKLGGGLEMALGGLGLFHGGHATRDSLGDISTGGADITPPTDITVPGLPVSERAGIVTPEVMAGGGPRTKNEILQSGAKVPNWDKVNENGMVWVDNLNGEGEGGYTTKTNAKLIDDTNRMATDRITRQNDPVIQAADKAKNDAWNNQQRALSVSEGKFNEPNTKPIPDSELTPEQLAIRKSYQAIKDHSDEYASWVSEQEETHGEDFKPPADVEAKYKTEQTELRDAHQKLVDEYLANERGSTTPITQKRNIKANGDGTFTDKNTGEIFDKSGKLITPAKAIPAATEPELTVPEPPKVIPKLPTDLKGAKPRYGDKTVDFSNDLDRALYIVAQKEPSRRDADYVKWLMKVTGLDEATLRKMGREYKAHLSSTLRDPDFNGTVPSFHDWQDLLPDAPIRGLGGKGGKVPPVTPPEGDLTSSGGRTLKPGQDDTLMNYLKNTSLGEKTIDVLNVPRAIMASTDMSAPLRQGLPMIHRGEWWKALAPMGKSFFSEDTYNAVRAAIDDKPLFRVGSEGEPSFAKQAGLFLSDLGHLSDREEAIMSGLAERLPGAGRIIRGSNRAYTTFLNKLRADTFENMVTKLGAQNDPMLAKAIAKYINVSTGRGSLGSFEGAAKWLNTGLFAPRNVAAKFTTLNPAYYVTLPPQVRKEALKSLFAVTGVGMSLGALGKMAGAQVSTDPTSTDFGKIKIGDTRLDPFGGYQQYAVPAARLLDWAIAKETGASNGTVHSTLRDKDYKIKPINEIGNFWRKKENPVFSFVHGWLSGQNAIGQPFQAGPELRNMFIPMVLQDLADVARNDPDLLPLTTPLSVLGMSVQSYKPNTDRYMTGNANTDENKY